MGRAVRGLAAGGQRNVTGRRDGLVAELRYHWGEAYDIEPGVGRRGTVITARRRDGRGSLLADRLAEGLRLRIRADYSACPVPRDVR